MVPSFPKILAVGSPYIPNLFVGDIEITEKVDGSMIGFGIDEKGDLRIRSKGQELFVDNPERMFAEGIEYIASIKEILLAEFPRGTWFYGEYLKKPKHNVLAYERTPKNNIIIFGAFFQGTGWVSEHGKLSILAEKMGLEVVPLIFSGPISFNFPGDRVMKNEGVVDQQKKFDYTGFERLKAMIGQTMSTLGNEIIEGIVVKNYGQTIILGGQVYPSFGKYVREQFKERLDKTWDKEHSHGGQLDTFLQSFKTEARWLKAVQHLKEKGELKHEPRDIGLILREVHRDIIEEERENIKNELFDLFEEKIKRISTAGFPDWYKDELLKRGFTHE